MQQAFTDTTQKPGRCFCNQRFHTKEHGMFFLCTSVCRFWIWIHIPINRCKASMVDTCLFLMVRFTITKHFAKHWSSKELYFKQIAIRKYYCSTQSTEELKICKSSKGCFRSRFLIALKTSVFQHGIRMGLNRCMFLKQPIFSLFLHASTACWNYWNAIESQT